MKVALGKDHEAKERFEAFVHAIPVFPSSKPLSFAFLWLQQRLLQLCPSKSQWVVGLLYVWNRGRRRFKIC